MTKGTKLNWIMAVALLPAFALNLMFGAVDIPVSDVFNIMFGKANCNEAWKYIILQTRLPQAITAILCGSSLAISGLLLQTAFRNPLAGPSIFGINSGASLGAALVLLAFGGSMTLGGVPLTGFFAVIIAAFWHHPQYHFSIFSPPTKGYTRIWFGGWETSAACR